MTNQHANVLSKHRFVPFLISSPLISCWRSRVRLRGATYCAQAASIDFEIKDDRIGIFMTFGRDFDIGTTDIDTRGRPISVTSVVLMKGGSGMSSSLVKS